MRTLAVGDQKEPVGGGEADGDANAWLHVADYRRNLDSERVFGLRLPHANRRSLRTASPLPWLWGSAPRRGSGSGEPGVISDFQPAQRVLRRRHRPIGRALLGAASVACGGWALAGGVGATTAPTAAVTVVVRPGDTVWSIAESHSGGGDVRDEVAQILSANHLASPVIQAGETLVIPSA